MENLFNDNNTKFFASLGQELILGDLVKWSTSGMTLYGRIEKFEDGKIFVKTLGGFYQTDEEANLIRTKAKPIYKISNSRRLVKMQKKAA